ncbi:MAG: VOC family protein [Ruthenibacterium lactatiformans]
MCEYCDAKPSAMADFTRWYWASLPARAKPLRNSRRRRFVVITHSDTKTPVNPDCCGLEFAVDDVDAEYERLLTAGISVERPPVTYPWGYRAIGFRDPDGNNIDFTAYVGKPE